MAYRALYREWRPKNFTQMVGQKAIIETLQKFSCNATLHILFIKTSVSLC